MYPMLSLHRDRVASKIYLELGILEGFVSYGLNQGASKPSRNIVVRAQIVQRLRKYGEVMRLVVRQPPREQSNEKRYCEQQMIQTASQLHIDREE